MFFICTQMTLEDVPKHLMVDKIRARNRCRLKDHIFFLAVDRIQDSTYSKVHTFITFLIFIFIIKRVGNKQKSYYHHQYLWITQRHNI